MSKRDKKSVSNAAPKPGSLVSAVNLRKTYRMGKLSLEVLKGVSFDVRAGEFMAIFGHSGSGKSTLLHLLGLLDTPSAGTVFIESTDTAKLPASKRNKMRSLDVGFIFQFYHLLPELTVLENTMLPSMVGSSVLGFLTGRRAHRQRAAELLDELGLGDRLKHRPKELSGGERQRVAIARALVNKPKLLLADEPTGNLDSKTGQKIMDVLLRFNRENHQTILMVTHDEDLAAEVGRSITLQDGRLTK